MSKAMLVTVPFVLLLLDFWPLNRMQNAECRMQNGEAAEGAAGNWRRLVSEKVPFFVLAAMSCVVTLVVQKQGGAVRTFQQFPLGARLENAVVAYARYLGKTVWPEPLAVFYPHPGYWPAVYVALAVALLAGLCLGALGLRRRFPFALTGWFWFVGTLAPVIGIVQVGAQSLADRYTYIPLIGVFIVLAWGGSQVAARWGVPNRMMGMVAGLVLGLCGLRTMDQLRYWKNTEALYGHALAVTKKNSFIWSLLGNHYYNLGNQAKAAGRFEPALTFYHRALEINPDDALAHNNLGIVFQATGRLDEAVKEYLAAMNLVPTNANAHNNLGVAFTRQGRIDEAIEQFSEALRLAPESGEGHNNLGALWSRKGRFDEALRHYVAAARLMPDNPAVFVNLGDALAHEGRMEEAVANYRKAFRLNPNDPTAQRRLKALDIRMSE